MQILFYFDNADGCFGEPLFRRNITWISNGQVDPCQTVGAYLSVQCPDIKSPLGCWLMS